MSALITLKNVVFKVPTLEKAILSNVTYQVNKGDFIVILGSNGSGKSSLLKLLDRHYHPTSGKILLNGKSLDSLSVAEFSKRVITLTQNTHESLFGSLTVLENYLIVKQRFDARLFHFSEKKDRQYLTSYLMKFNPNLADKMNQVVDKLSGGEKQALALALSVYHPPDVLLLDEHTSALDPKSAKQLMALTNAIVTEHHMTCILTTHDLDIAMQYGNRILALRQGEIYQTFEMPDKKKATQQSLLLACY